MSLTVKDSRRISVLAVCAFPVEAAATRFRLQQFVEPLRERNIDLTISPFLSSQQFRSLYRAGSLPQKMLGMGRSLLRRIDETFSIGRYDTVLVQREAMLFGPGVFEWIYSRLGGKPLVLDLDDATYVRYVSPTYGRLGSALKFFSKTDNLIRRSSAVLCGNRFIAEHVASVGGNPVTIPTVVDQNVFKPTETTEQRLTIGWIGTHSTYPFLEKILPVIYTLGRSFDFDLKIIGAGAIRVNTQNVRVQSLDWDLKREPDDFGSLDIGLYPIFPEGAANEEWIKGKSGFKAIQYMACGVPFVMSPVGVCAEIGTPGVTHFNAETEEDWYNSLGSMLREPEIRRKMGMAARQYSLDNLGIGRQADKMAEVIKGIGRR